MSARQSHRPPSSPSSSYTGAKATHTSGPEREEEDLSIISGLTSLENEEDAEVDDLDRLILQNARDERRLRDALRGNVQPFRNARTHPRVGLTMENLERHAGHTNGAVGIKGPSSSSGGSDPAVRPPLEWGRKARVRRNWLQTITADSEGGQISQAEEMGRDTAGATPRPTDAADIPRRSVEDSPLSHKSSQKGTPVHSRRKTLDLEQEPDFDFTMDFNEASLIASTPYVPRNPTLDDIRQREIESLREQVVNKSRPAEMRESSPEEASHLRPMVTEPKPPTEIAACAELRLSLSPVLTARRRPESLGVADTGRVESRTPKPLSTQEDSHNLLRRLARASSNTPSPGRIPNHGSQSVPALPETRRPATKSAQTDHPPSGASEISKSLVLRSTHGEPGGAENQLEARTASGSDQQPVINAAEMTPAPAESSARYVKTPVVTGAWIDTPGPRTIRRPAGETSQPHAKPAEKDSPSKGSPQTGRGIEEAKSPTQPAAPIAVTHPTLPSSALQALVEGARGKGKGGGGQQDDELGDSTIDSLEELIECGREEHTGDLDEDTLQGLQLPTEPPKNEAERQRQKELAQLHKMNQRLRAARTSIRDASRGIRRVEHQVEHIEGEGERTKVVQRELVDARSLWGSTWKGFKRLFYKPEHPGRHGLTWLSIALITFWIWFISENLACERYCHKLYASEMVGYGVVWDAPRYPFVLPTLLWRNLVRPVGAPIWNLIAWLYEDEAVKEHATATAGRAATRIFRQRYTGETFEPDLSMGDDEII
ncbi:uncharacterized protein EI97DRAFT_460533 [Westerdykella ornata]|uniref:Uncharacterized protein n=1 Tax=Westerdykella ornata TaxID=318751 RepID=A0A6A6JC47_WESOR|nr:uncharacterized protein EI97DRAFT_460533 [Westerdykella ornata]KAF2274141.1 hypothetical protein EI97DRAFT_460533 [Westerdykella ornata]